MAKDVELPISAVVLFCKRPQVASIVRTEFKRLGLDLKTFHETETPLETNGLIEQYPTPLLVIDWDMGIQKCLLVLQAVRRANRLETAPTMILASEVNEKLLAAATEYGVAKMNTGDVTAVGVKVLIQELMEDLRQMSPVRTALIEAERLRRAGDADAALSILTSTWDGNRQNIRVTAALAEAYIQRREWDRCLTLLAPFQNHSPPPSQLIYLFGRCLMMRGDFRGACDAFQKAKLINPLNVDRLLDLGNTLLNLGQTDKAQQEFSEAQRLDPSNADATTGMGKVLLMQGEINDALELLQAVAQGHQMASIFNSAAILTMRFGDHKKGLNLYDAALKVVSHDDALSARVYYNKGIGFVRDQQMARAKECFAKALKLDPTLINAKHNIAVLERKAKGGAAKLAAPATPKPVASDARFHQGLDAGQSAPANKANAAQLTEEEMDFLSELDEKL